MGGVSGTSAVRWVARVRHTPQRKHLSSPFCSKNCVRPAVVPARSRLLWQVGGEGPGVPTESPPHGVAVQLRGRRWVKADVSRLPTRPEV